MSSTFADQITVDEIEEDPYPIYARLRQEAPVAYAPALNSWLVTTWADVQTVTTNPDLFRAEDDNAPVVRHFGKPAIIHCDGPVHQELRRGIAPHYAPKKVAEYIDDLVRPIAQDCIAAFDPDRPVDLVAAYFEPISVLTLARSFGVMDVDVDQLRQWFHGLAMGAINFSQDPERSQICADTLRDIDRAFDPIFARLEQEPDDSPLSQMLYHSMPEGQRRSREFVMPSIRVTLLGGMQEPGHGAANTLVALLQNPGQMQMLRADPDRHLRAAVVEGCRWTAPIGTQIRAATRDLELGGAQIRAGDTVSAVIASANRDAAVFARPDDFDLERSEKSQATFGFGGHFCAGKWMALSQMELALRILLETFPRIALVPGQPPVFFGWEFRAPTSLMVTLGR